MASKADVGKLVSMLSAAYPNWNPTEYTVEIYYQDLQDIPSDVLDLACRHCRTSVNRNQSFAPSAGEIRQAAADIKRQAQKVPSGIEAWGELLHVPATEQYKRVMDDNVIETTPYQWSHPLVRKVAVMLGFPKFPDWEQESFERVAFLKAYETELQSYLKQDNQLPQVTGFIEAAGQDPALFMAEQKIKQLTKGMSK